MALEGIKVLDLSRVLAGPFSTQILGDLGADIIKVERPGVGDDTRHWGPPFTSSQTAAYYTCANRNKRSITLDLKQEKAKAVIKGLAARSDIVVENYRVGELDKLGLGYKDLSAINPGIIYCSITGFGQNGPRASQPGYDFLIQAMGGLMSITGNPESEGVKVGVAVTDLFTGMWAAVAILAALQFRRETGKGQYIDLALFDCQLSMLANVASNWFVSARRPLRFGNSHPNIVPYQTFSSADASFALAVGNDRQFKALCQELGKVSIAEDERFKTNSARVANRQECVKVLQQIFATLTTDEVLQICERAGVPAGRINNVDEAFTDLQAEAREMVVKQLVPMDHCVESEEVLTVGSPLKFSESVVTYRQAPPRLGQHTREVLTELGYNNEEIDLMYRNGIL